VNSKNYNKIKFYDKQMQAQKRMLYIDGTGFITTNVEEILDILPKTIYGTIYDENLESYIIKLPSTGGLSDCTNFYFQIDPNTGDTHLILTAPEFAWAMLNSHIKEIRQRYDDEPVKIVLALYENDELENLRESIENIKSLKEKYGIKETINV
jgi:hypothetical protein